MKITKSTDQAECIAILDTLAIRHTFQPKPPSVTSDSLMQLDPTTFLVGTNDSGSYTLYVLEGTTQKEAMQFLQDLAKDAGMRHINTRLQFVGDEHSNCLN